MTFTQHRQITTDLRGPFVLTKVPRALAEKQTRKTYRCGFTAVAALRNLKLDPKRYWGADVADANGVIVAELE